MKRKREKEQNIHTFCTTRWTVQGSFLGSIFKLCISDPVVETKRKPPRRLGITPLKGKLPGLHLAAKFGGTTKTA